MGDIGMQVFSRPIIDLMRITDAEGVPGLMLEAICKTGSDSLAENSVCQFRGLKDGSNVCTLLGLINGVLPSLTGQYLFQVTDDETGEVSWRIDDESHVVWKDKGKE